MRGGAVPMAKKKPRNFLARADQALRKKQTVAAVYIFLRFAVILVMVAQFFNGNFENVFLCLLTLVLLLLPTIVERSLQIDLPNTLEIIIMLFIFAAEILGEIRAFYTTYPGWDTMLHTLNGFLCAAIGFSLVDMLNRNERFSLSLSPTFMAIVAFCFSMTIGVLWEFFEFAMDWFFHTDMQRDTVVNAIYSASLDVTRSNKVVSIRDIQDVLIHGESLGLGGYLDIGLIDTMKDLIVNFIGAVVFSVTGFFYALSKGRKRTPAQNFVPSKKTADRDYLAQVREESTPSASPADSPSDQIPPAEES